MREQTDRLSGLTPMAVPGLGEKARAWAFPAGVTALFVLALILRLHGLNDAPIWTDEAFTAIVARLPMKVLPFGRIDNHPPLYYLVQHLWQSLFPGLDAVRIPAAVIAALTVPVMALAGGDLISKRAGLTAGLFLALSTIHNAFGQEARMYSLTCLGLILALWGVAGCLRNDRSRLHAALYVVGGVIAVYSHAIGLFFLAAVGATAGLAILMGENPRPRFIRFAALNAVLLVLVLPWLIALPDNAATFPGLSRAGPDLIPYLVMNAIGYPGLEPLLMRLATLTLIALIGYGVFRRWKAGDRVLVLLLMGSLILYPVLIAALSLRVNLIANRVFLPCTLSAALLVALALEEIKGRLWRNLALIALATTGLASTVIEQALRMKVENVPFSLDAAARKGFASGPVIGCGMFGTISTHLLAPQRPAYYLLGSSFVRFNDRYEKTFAMPINDHRTVSAEALDRFAGGGLKVADAAAEFAPFDKVVVLTTYCDATRLAPTHATLSALGYVEAGEAAPPTLRPTLEVNAWPTELWLRKP